MLTSLSSSSSSTAPLDSEERRVKARHRRREAAAPYPVSKRGEKEDEKDDEKGEDVGGRGTARGARGSGFFARLASYIPIVNKLVKEDDVDEGPLESAMESYDDIQTTQEDVDEEEEDGEEEEEETAKKEKVMPCTETTVTQPILEHQPEAVEKEQTSEKKAMLDAPVSPPSRTAPSFSTHKDQPTTPFRHNRNKRESRNGRSPSRESGPESGERSCAMIPSPRKRGDKRVFLPGPSQQSKTLHIANTQRRRKSASPSPHDSALAVIKKRKTITLDEFERLQHQLHEMVETTPQAQLAMTQAALANGLERPFTRGFPGPTSFPGYVPGSIANPNHGALVIQDEKKCGSEYSTKNGVPFGKRPRKCENGPILFSGTSLRGQLTREERLMRKPRPSRLLTGAKRDISMCNAYSAAVAEKILSTLKKVQTPLEREAQKPTPSTSMSWAKYHLSLVDSQKKSLENGVNTDSNDVPPPTTTVPRVTFPQSSMKPAALSYGSQPRTAFDTPSKSDNAESDGVTSLFSPQAVSMTPVPAAKTSAPEQLQFQTTGEFKFTLPLRVQGMKQTSANDEDIRVQFVFSPPPSMREPPVKVSNQKAAPKVNSTAAPFDFMPSSPKIKATECVSKPPTARDPEKRKAGIEKPVAAETAEGSGSGSMTATSGATLNSAVNPLARFMQLKPGQWKCPGCSVLNEATSVKCPCCETAKPGGGVTAKSSSVAPNAPASGFGLDVVTVDAKKDTDKPVAGSITEGGFRFVAPSVDSKKDTDKPAALISSSGFSFGAPAGDTTKDADKPAANITSSGGFSFTAPAVSDSSFGTTATSDLRAESLAGTAPISFGFSAPVKKTDDALTKTSDVIGKAASAPSFSFGVSAASTPTPDQSSAATNSTSVSSGFTFGGTCANTADGISKGKRKAPEAEVSANDSAPSFNFDATTPANTASGFSFGVAPEPKQASPEESGRPTKRLAGSIGVSDLKPDASVFTFTAASTAPEVPAKECAKTPALIPSFNFGGSSSSTITQNAKETTTRAFSLGTPSTEKASFPTEAKEMMPSKTGFTFGSSSAAEPKPTAGFGHHTESKAAAFSFAASASTSGPAFSAQVTSTPASSSTGFTFGQNTALVTSNAPASGAAPSAPAFGFGVPTPTPHPSGTSTPPIAEKPSTASSTPAFTFGSSCANPAGSSSFGQMPPSTSSFGSTSTAFGSSNSSVVFGSGSNAGGFGSTSTAAPATTFGNSASSTPAAPAFSFEASSQGSAASAPAPTAGQPAFSFGASSAPAPAAPAVSSGFGSSGSNGGFGAAPVGFRSSSPAPAFGNQTAPAFGSNRPPLTSTFGGPAFGAPACSGFGSGPPSSGFRTPSPTPAFGAAQSAPAFGTAPSTGFGAIAPAPGFGASGFGAPAASAFGASADGGFNMGAAPQHAKGRRILKAKSRNRRTS